jgi:hypothetical protein
LINRGSEKCSDNEKNLVTTFALSSNGKKITLEGYELAIDQLSEQKIQLSLGISGNLAKMVFTAK